MIIMIKNYITKIKKNDNNKFDFIFLFLMSKMSAKIILFFFQIDGTTIFSMFDWILQKQKKRITK
jgi:hypothetical protein